MRYLPLLILTLGACAAPSARDERPGPAAPVADERNEARRRRVAALERQVVEDQERLREAQLMYDGLRDRYLMARDAAAAHARNDEADRAAARDSEPYQALVKNLRDAADALEQRGQPPPPPELSITLARLADLMQASEVRPADAEETARWERELADARELSRALRHTNGDAASAAGRLVDAFVSVCWFWQDFDGDRAAAARAELPDEDQRARRELAEASQLHQRARDALEDAKRALREHETALSQARAASQDARANPR